MDDEFMTNAKLMLQMILVIIEKSATKEEAIKEIKKLLEKS